MTKREASENLAIALSEWRDAGGPVEAVVMAIRQLEEAAEDDPPEPEIKPGELVYAWDGDTKPRRPSIAFFEEMRDNKCIVAFSSWPEDRASFEHVERFYMPFTEEQWARFPDVKWIVDFDNTARIVYEINVCPWSLGEEARNGSRVVRILKRPEGK